MNKKTNITQQAIKFINLKKSKFKNPVLLIYDTSACGSWDHEHNTKIDLTEYPSHSNANLQEMNIRWFRNKISNCPVPVYTDWNVRRNFESYIIDVLHKKTYEFLQLVE